MTTAIATRPITFTDLPQLRVDRIPEDVAASPAFGSITARYRLLNERARTALSDFQAAQTAIATAHAQDRETAVADLIDDKTPTAKQTEAAAIQKAEKAHAAAVATITASNRLLAQIRDKIRGEEGAEVQSHFTAEQTAAHRRLGESLDSVATCIAEVVELSSTVKWIAEARRRDRAGLPTINRQVKPLAIHGSPTAPAHLIEHLRSVGAEAGEL